jgi:hypothetical protein
MDGEINFRSRHQPPLDRVNRRHHMSASAVIGPANPPGATCVLLDDAATC